MSWNDRWMGLAEHIASWSKDRSTKVGAVIIDDRNSVISLGWNGFPRGVLDGIESRHQRPEKYRWTEHAERNAIYNAASMGSILSGNTLFTTLFCCSDCARAIIQSGIKKIVSPKPLANTNWSEDFKISLQMLGEAGVIIEYYVRTQDTKDTAR